MSLKILFATLLIALATAVSHADVPPPPPLDEIRSSEDIPEPEVVIIHKEEVIIEEYRVRGQLRYAKIIPAKGVPYYMFDSDGDGILDTRHDDLDNPPINQWILFRW